MRTFDLVVAGDSTAARVAITAALRHGQRVLVVLRSADRRAAHRLRTCLRQAEGTNAGRLRIVMSAEVVCADGVDAVEAVVIRDAQTGRLWAVNACEFRSFASGVASTD